MTSQPLVSVVTPFFNTAPYLAQCIESVLAQTYSEFEYILMDNCSTDGSSEIAEAYARRDPRIRLVRGASFVPQLVNYNRALAEISKSSQYCKIVEADNYIFPDCLRLMAEAFKRSDSIGLVSAYCLQENEVLGSGYPFPTPIASGKMWARRYLLGEGAFIFGSPTTVMYRASIVRRDYPFFNESALHSDTEKCMSLLEHWDLGFVHQVLSFLRTENESISTPRRILDYQYQLDRYIVTIRFASVFLNAAEAKSVVARFRREYYRYLVQGSLWLGLARFRREYHRYPIHDSLRPHLGQRAFWKYHRNGLSTIGQTLDLKYLVFQIGLELLRMASNPGITIARALRALSPNADASDGGRFLDETTGFETATTSLSPQFTNKDESRGPT